MLEKTKGEGKMRNFFAKLRSALQRFMVGRYGTDKLNMAILITSLAICVVGMFIPNATVRLVLTLISYVLMGVAIWRCFSRSTYKRYRENCKYLQLLDRIKDRQHKYFDCPRCKQTVRVPRGKGKIAVKCPKCGEKFIRKS